MRKEKHSSYSERGSCLKAGAQLCVKRAGAQLTAAKHIAAMLKEAVAYYCLFKHSSTGIR
jgi:hypothetical protein